MKCLLSVLIICLMCTSCRDELDDCSDFLQSECAKLKIEPYYEYDGWGDLYNESGSTKLSVDFYLKEKVSLEEIRRTFVYVHKTILSKLNENIVLLDDLRLDLFSKENFAVRFLIASSVEKESSKDFYIHSTSNRGEIITYYMVNDFDKEHKKHKETIEEAYRIIEEEERLNK